jgi:hypothetical protein
MNIRSKVDNLLRTRFTITQKAWRQELHKVRSEVFGKNYQSALFPVKLHKITSDEYLDQEIFWLSDGESFAIHRELYERRIMGIFFDQTTRRSTQRILEKYGFERQFVLDYEEIPPYSAIQYNVYSHPYFIRAREDLAYKITMDHESNAVSSDIDNGVLSRNYSFSNLMEDVFGKEKGATAGSVSTVSTDSFQCLIDASGIEDLPGSDMDCSSVGSSLHGVVLEM